MSQTASREVIVESLAHPLPEQVPPTSVAGRRWQKDDLVSIYEPIADDLGLVEQILRAELCRDTPWVDRLLEHNWIGGGKRIRPVFLLLAGAACGKLGPGHHQLAAAVEMIHAATLVHDDVIDKAETRRHLPTVNATWDNRTSVLLGDFLFTHAFYVASLANDPHALRVLSQSSNKVCEGEIRQNAWQGNFELEELDYLAMISDKTGELCGCSCRIGAMLSGADPATSEQFARFGLNLGIAFQIIDDVLDVVGQQAEVGKTLGTDLLNQKPTLPIIHCLKNSTTVDRQRLLDMLQSNSATVDDVLPLLTHTDSIRYSRALAQDHAGRALRFAETLCPSPYSTALHHLARFVLARMH